MIEAIEEIDRLIVERSLAGADEGVLVDLFCESCERHGLPLWRTLFIVDTLHPVYEGRVFRWRNDGVEEERLISYGRSDEGEARERWEQSIFYRMFNNGETEARRRFGRGDPADYGQMAELVSDGCTDYVAFAQRFDEEGVIGDLDSMFCYFLARSEEGFTDEHLQLLRSLLPKLTLAIKCASFQRIASTLVEVYLGRDAKERVLRGRISRGVAERIQTVLWFSDLRSFTTITDTADPEEIIPLLNDYSGAAIEAIHGAGGDVLKLIGDGILAIFNFHDDGEAALAAIRAEKELRRKVATIDERRRAENRPVTAIYLALHIGEVFYGNIGASRRVDFTVIGAAVNLASRIEKLCDELGRNLVLTEAFSRHCDVPTVPLGTFSLKGIAVPQPVFGVAG